MNKAIADVLDRVAAFEREANVLLSAFESAPSRVISLAETRKKLDILSLKQAELLDEAVSAVEHGLYRSAIVTAWAAFMDFLEEKLASDGFAGLRLVRPKWSSYSTLEELREGQSEHAILEAARELKLLYKAEFKTLQGLLSKRNECAHPSGYQPNLNEALGYISELLNRIAAIGERDIVADPLSAS